MSGPAVEDAAPERPGIAAIQEIRFAVVLYGGVSLSIYINGVAQELLGLVRATAPERRDGQPGPVRYPSGALRGAEPVYRRLAAHLGRRFAAPGTEAGAIHSRFAVDILAGTSAGGINGIFLAKALANGTTMDQLRTLWIEEGEMGVLLNDAASGRDMPPGYRMPATPGSLLNSQRMFHKVRHALDGLDPLAPDTPVPLADQLDLLVTATDLSGLVKPVALADKIVYERSYRSVFHFRFAGQGGAAAERSDFGADENPMLAFAARCTSSLPVAFEPMQLEDIRATELFDDAALRQRIEGTAKREGWGRFFRDYTRQQSGDRTSSLPLGERAWARRVQERSFGDGGYLDNKPFGHAIDMLAERRPRLVVERKLLYVEPSPENPEFDTAPGPRPDPFSNLALAASVLPRAELIRDDLERVRERNRLVERVHRATRRIDSDVRGAFAGAEPPPWVTLAAKHHLTVSDTWALFWLDDMIRVYGASCGPYHRLKVAALTTELAQTVTRAAGFDEESQQFEAVRYLVSAWRQSRFDDDIPEAQRVARATDELPQLHPGRPSAPRLESENRLLLDLDLAYRQRRIAFLQMRIDLLMQRGDVAREIATEVLGDVGAPAIDGWLVAVQPDLLTLQSALSTVADTLEQAGRRLSARDGSSPLADELARLGLSTDELMSILRPADPRARARRAREIFEAGDRVAGFARIEGLLKTQLRPLFDTASTTCTGLLQTQAGAESTPGGRLRAYLRERYESFDRYDIILFSIQYGTDYGEGRRVDVVRVSPEDATSLVRERQDGAPRRLAKLAGTSLGNFGAFLDTDWRHSDMLWGRLDAADRVIHALLPDEREAADVFVAEAQAAIVAETVRRLDWSQAAFQRLLVECLLRTDDDAIGRTELERLVAGLTRGAARLGPDDRAALLKVLDHDSLWDTFERRFAEGPGLPRERGLRLISRASRVFGRLLEGLSGRYPWLTKAVPTYLILIGRLLWGLVEIAVPGRFWTLAADWWWKLLYAFAALAVTLGLTLIRELLRPGLILLGALLVVDLARHALGRWLTAVRRRGPQRTQALGTLVWIAVGVLLAALAAWARAPLAGALAGLRPWAAGFVDAHRTALAVTLAAAALLAAVGLGILIGRRLAATARRADEPAARRGTTP